MTCNRRRFWLYVLSSVIPLAALGCRKSHASSEKGWALEVKNRGASSRRPLKYRFPKKGWGRYRLEVRVDADGVRCVDKAVVHLEIHARPTVADRGVLEVELTDFLGPGKRGETLVSRAQKIYWEMNSAGRTLRFSTEDLNPALITGLPDLGLLLRRMLPALPGDPVGAGARWSVSRPVEMGINPESGSGLTRAFERIDSRLAALGSSAGRAVAKVESRLTADYTGSLRAVARTVTVTGKGEGTVAATVDVESGRLLDATLVFRDRLQVTASGIKRTVRTAVRATLKPRTE
jgi:hypothetical protein